MTYNTSHPTPDLTRLTQHVGDYLRGYGRNNIQALESLVAYRSWSVLAQRELDHRATRIISSLGDEELRAIARGDLSLQVIAHAIAQELKGGAR